MEHNALLNLYQERHMDSELQELSCQPRGQQESAGEIAQNDDLQGVKFLVCRPDKTGNASNARPRANHSRDTVRITLSTVYCSAR